MDSDARPDHVTLETADERVVIIGDVHGCCDELEDLLKEHILPSDTVILAGDLVSTPREPLPLQRFHCR